jgi:hypothetical protein
MKSVLQDFKTERNDILPPLPAVLKIVPIGFVATLLGFLGMVGYSLKEEKVIKGQIEERRLAQVNEQNQMVALQALESSLSGEVKQAMEVKDWVASSTEVYPLVMKIARTVSKETTISDLTIGRDEENPAHLKMSLKLNSPRGLEQAEILAQEIQDSLRLRQYNFTTTPAENDNEVLVECGWAPAVAMVGSDAAK